MTLICTSPFCRRITRPFMVPALLLMIVAALSSCSNITTGSLPTGRSFLVGDSAIENDLHRGFTELPNTRIWIRSLLSSDSVFVEVRARDTLSLRSLLINGVSIWIDPQGKQRESFGVTFPAARAEILRRQEEIFQQMREQGDTVRTIPFEHAFWVESMQQRNNVITDNRGTRFATPSQAWMELAPDGSLVYRVGLAFSQLGITADTLPSFSVGVISERHQAQLINQGQGAQRTGASDPSGRPRQASTQPAERTQRMGLIPVRSWILFRTATPHSSETDKEEKAEE